MIASFVDRRIKHEVLRMPHIAETAKNLITGVDGVKNVSINQRAGSALIFYDELVLSVKIILNTISEYFDVAFETAIQKARSFNINTRRLTSTGLLVSLAVILISLVFGSKTLHIAGGLVFMFFMTIHIFRNKQILFA